MQNQDHQLEALRKSTDAPQTFMMDTPMGNEHPLLPIPFIVMLAERRLEGKGLSLIGGTASGLVDPSMDGKQELATLIFSFDGFRIVLSAVVNIRLNDNKSLGLVELEFADPVGPQLPQLRYIINAFIAGDIVGLGPLLSVPSVEKKKSGGRAKSLSFTDRLGQVVRKAGVAALVLGLLGAVALTVQNRVLTLDEIRPAVVTIEGEALRSPTAGQISFINAQAEEGDVAFAILSNSGAQLSVMMPCNCDITNVAFREGSTLLAGEEVMTLVEPGAGVHVDAVMSYEGINAALKGSEIEMVFADGRVVSATISPTSFSDIMMVRPSEWTPLTLVPEDSVAEADIGQMTRVRLRQPMPVIGGLLAWFGDGASLQAQAEAAAE
ncbi:hypothetical protein [Litoreibacter roseus]|uniref:Pilus assembly protein PilZ n=1 Tax=Litoreibacter roseus TaxID=2601869 RepID=A0A6N6JD04_9RHOB|nr:hypothetical protein [Litoreibacter roseus]GFE63198.1 hypothetical protein KIN_02720 [Litoreibacter roseus]